MSKVELHTISLYNENLGYLINGSYVSKEIFETHLDDLVVTNKKNELAIILAELGSKPQLNPIDKATIDGYLKNFGASLKTRLDHIDSESKAQTLSLAQTLAKAQNDALAQTQSLAHIQNQIQTDALAQTQSLNLIQNQT